MNYYEKYLKYKQKYLELKNNNNMVGGAKSEIDDNETKINEIIKFITKSNKKQIVKKLIDIFQYFILTLVDNKI